jgi:SH3-like domain-containing protein
MIHRLGNCAYACLFILASFGGLLAMQPANAQMSDPMSNIPKSKIGDSNLPIPRFVSIKSNKANARRGPGTDYPVIWQYRKAHLPLMVVDEYQAWRKLRDHDGSEFWMRGDLLSSNRYALTVVTDYAEPVRSRPDNKSLIIALLQKYSLVGLEECRGKFCRVETEHGAGWTKRNALWGALPNETIK